MNLEKVKKKVAKYLNKDCHYIYTGSRNQIEEFDGRIVELYQSIFIIETSNGIIKAFCYSDFATNNLKILT